MLVNFAKMHGLGNDFVVIDCITQNLRLDVDHIQRIADRHLGIGCDQVILIEPPIHKHSDFYYRIYNADGEEVEQCGNGARCAARFFYDSGYINISEHRTDDSTSHPIPNSIPRPTSHSTSNPKSNSTLNSTSTQTSSTPTSSHKPLKLIADCLAGTIEFTIEEDDAVSVSMGQPIFSPADIPTHAPHQGSHYSLTLENTPSLNINNPLNNILNTTINTNTASQENTSYTFTFFAVSMGNPHAILEVPNVTEAPVQTLGPIFAKHPFFPKGTNVEFMQIVNPSHIRLRVYERGVGETLACGTGACAAVVAGIQERKLKSPVKVSFKTGDLIISWSHLDAPVYMKGPTATVFVGRFRL